VCVKRDNGGTGKDIHAVLYRQKGHKQTVTDYHHLKRCQNHGLCCFVLVKNILMTHDSGLRVVFIKIRAFATQFFEPLNS
jgi:hypothetical protein